ncbi:hypothetical protein ZWY2020_024651 [Hordeum vulgare]|nr:hypothetical protein ZWY2020_024651 [Hordeum vulgare]
MRSPHLALPLQVGLAMPLLTHQRSPERSPYLEPPCCVTLPLQHLPLHLAATVPASIAPRAIAPPASAHLARAGSTALPPARWLASARLHQNARPASPLRSSCLWCASKPPTPVAPTMARLASPPSTEPPGRSLQLCHSRRASP